MLWGIMRAMDGFNSGGYEVGRISEGKSPAIGQLRPWHKSMARMMVAGGLRPGELAEIFGMSASQVSIITNSPLFVAERQRLEALAEYEAVDVRQELEMRHGIAVQVIDEALTSRATDPTIKRRVGTAFDILDRTGFGKTQEVQRHLHLHAHKEVKEMKDEELEEEIMDSIRSGGS